MKVKICGITTEQDIKLCVNAGADALGFVVEYPEDVPWNLEAEKATHLIKHVPHTICSFMVTGGSPDKVVNLAQRVRPNIVQLHHNETLSEVRNISKQLVKIDIRTVKALRVDQHGTLNFEIPSITEAVRALEYSGIDALLIDSFTQTRPGGTGHIVDIDAYRTLCKNTSLPIILAGGLTPDNLHEIVPEQHPPYMLDVLSGVEISPGIKDKNKVASFVMAAQTLKEERI